MITTNRIVMEYTQKETRRGLKCFIIKHLLNINQTLIEKKGQKSYKVYRKQIARDRSKSFISTTTLNVNGLNFLIKRQRMSERIRKMNNLYVTYKIQFRCKDMNMLKVKE